MKRSLLTGGLLGAVVACGMSTGAPRGRIVADDVRNFVVAHGSLAPDDTKCMALTRYFESASDGLAAFPRITGAREDLCAAVHSNPRRYADVAKKLEDLQSVRPRLEQVYSDYREFFGTGNLPDTYIVVGRGWWGGTVRNERIYVGLEVMDVEAVPCLAAHELAHAHQRYPRRKILTRGGFLRGTVLAQSIKEGTADFVAHVMAGCRPDETLHEWAGSRGAELWERFQQDMDGRDYSLWVYNGWNREQLDGWPPDLGYYVGYKIAEAFYEAAGDKRTAIMEMLAIRDFPAFLERSGYAGKRKRDAS